MFEEEGKEKERERIRENIQLEGRLYVCFPVQAHWSGNREKSQMTSRKRLLGNTMLETVNVKCA